MTQSALSVKGIDPHIFKFLKCFPILLYFLKKLCCILMILLKLLLLFKYTLRRADPPTKESYHMSLYVDREAH
jgi:hypothetical protein